MSITFKVNLNFNYISSKKINCNLNKRVTLFYAIIPVILDVIINILINNQHLFNK